ncbi:MAG: hypothetical protein ABIO38_01570 [Luteimonas sp.]
MRKSLFIPAMLLAACGGTETVPAAQAAASRPAVGANGIERAPAALVVDTAPESTTQMDTGAIVGSLSYPSEVLPAMRVCAFELADGASHCTSSVSGQHEYRIEGVPRGDYQVLVYPRDGSGAPGGYTGCADDLNAGCTAHDLRVVVVEAGKATYDIDPADFYAGNAAVDWPVEP